MILSRLSIVNFKNIAQADLSFSPNINCFLGNNGMGKSNLLDAIYYLSFCKSYTRNPDSQNIRHGEDFLSYKVITSVTETKKNCIAVSNADRKKRLNGTKKNMTDCRIISGLPP